MMMNMMMNMMMMTMMMIPHSVSFLTACLSVKKSGRSRELLEQHLKKQELNFKVENLKEGEKNPNCHKIIKNGPPKQY